MNHRSLLKTHTPLLNGAELIMDVHVVRFCQPLWNCWPAASVLIKMSGCCVVLLQTTMASAAGEGQGHAAAGEDQPDYVPP